QAWGVENFLVEAGPLAGVGEGAVAVVLEVAVAGLEAAEEQIGLAGPSEIISKGAGHTSQRPGQVAGAGRHVAEVSAAVVEEELAAVFLRNEQIECAVAVEINEDWPHSAGLEIDAGISRLDETAAGVDCQHTVAG